MIVGAEHVSFSAVATLAHAAPRSRAWSPSSRSISRCGRSGPARRSATGRRSGRAPGQRDPRLRAGGVGGAHRARLRAARGRSNATWSIFTADWIPDHELAVMAGCELDRLAADRSSTRRCARPHGACSRRATCCTRPRPLTSALSTVATWRRRGRLPARCPGSGRPDVRLIARDPLAWVAPEPAAGRRTRSAARSLPPALARVRAPGAASRSARTVGSSGAAGSAVSSRVARRTSPRPGLRRVDPAGGPVIVCGEIGLRP